VDSPARGLIKWNVPYLNLVQYALSHSVFGRYETSGAMARRGQRKDLRFDPSGVWIAISILRTWGKYRIVEHCGSLYIANCLLF